MTISIKRPVVSVIPSPSGNGFTYVIECEHWTNDYIRSEVGYDLTDVTKLSENFAKRFEAEAKVIESTQVGRGIMKAYVAHRDFYPRPKIAKHDAKLAKLAY